MDVMKLLDDPAKEVCSMSYQYCPRNLYHDIVTITPIYLAFDYESKTKKSMFRNITSNDFIYHFLIPASMLFSLISILRVSFKYLILSCSDASSSGILRSAANVVMGFARSLTQSGYSDRSFATGASSLFMKSIPGIGVPGFMPTIGFTEADEKKSLLLSLMHVEDICLAYTGRLAAIFSVLHVVWIVWCKAFE